MEITRTFDLLDRYQSNFRKEDAFVVKRNGKWTSFSTDDYIRNAHYFAYGLLASGFKKGDKIATVSNNRPEWNFIDLGMAMAGVVHVPLFTSLSSSDYEYMLRHSDARMLIVSDDRLYNKISPVAAGIEAIEKTCTFDHVEGAANWNELVELGKKSEVYYKEELIRIKQGIQPDDFASLIYTSGTTGNAKAVMLSHRNLVENFLAAARIFQMTPDQKYLSILPLCHVGGRMGNYQTQYCGSTICYAENMGTIAANMKELQPHGFDAVPRILEKIFDKVLAKGKQLKGIKKTLFFWAVRIGLKYKLPEESNWLYRVRHQLADKLIFSKWRDALGGNIQLVGCGGASLQPRLERVFWACGIKVLNMYGLTETSPIITINRKNPPKVKLGSVGAVIDGVEVKIAGDGEIICRGHNVMLGYYKDPEMTKMVLAEDGWFHTGDIGEMSKDGFLFIKDRKKEIFKLSSGKFIAPQIIENKLKESLFIEQLLVVGEHEKFASAIIMPDFSYIEDWCSLNKIPFGSKHEIVQDHRVFSAINNDVKRFNKSFANPERINRIRLVTDEWSAATGELSPTLKLKRKVLHQKYQPIIDQIYRKQKV